MASSWNEKRALERIETRYEEVEKVSIVEYTKDMSLENIPVNKAYRMAAAHLYADIVNFDEVLATTDHDGSTSHKRALRFLNLHYRAVHRILDETDARRVDFQNQRLHAVVAKPYGSDGESARVTRAVAIANLIIEVLKETGAADDRIPNARVRVGIDTGKALVVNNGRRGGREPLFLGRPANQAAKCAGAGRSVGIFLTNTARAAVGLDELPDGSDRTTALTAEQIKSCMDAAKLGVSKDQIVKLWKEELAESPLAEVSFSRPAPPLKNLNIESLSLANSKRFEGTSVYADIDGFSAYVESRIDTGAEDVVRALHVLRSELDQVVSSGFGGRRIRFIGDCIHGLLLEGTAYETDTEETLSCTTLCAGALRSSFDVAKGYLEDRSVEVSDLGLAIGFDFGPTSISRLGMRSAKVRCAIGRNVLEAEAEQQRCSGTQTAIGSAAYKAASVAIQDLFGATRRVSNLDYGSAVDALASGGDKTAKAAEAASYQEAKPAVVPALSQPLRPYSLD
jgi:class 3 adenylate cyclase